jgi:nicotinamidase-related amidase
VTSGASRIGHIFATPMSTLPGPRAALLVVDVQVGVVANAWDRDRVVSNVRLAVDRARDAGLPVVWVQHHADDLPRDSDAWKWVPELVPGPAELRIHKGHNSAFEDTDLASRLGDLQVSHVVLAGAATNWCIRATAHGALDRGYDVTLLSDAHTTETMELASGRTIEALALIDELNVAMRWLSYPGRTNAATATTEVDFRTLAGAAA